MEYSLPVLVLYGTKLIQTLELKKSQTNYNVARGLKGVLDVNASNLMFGLGQASAAWGQRKKEDDALESGPDPGAYQMLNPGWYRSWLKCFLDVVATKFATWDRSGCAAWEKRKWMPA